MKGTTVGERQFFVALTILPLTLLPLVLLPIAVLPQAALGVTLEFAYVTAGPQDGYEKYVELSPSVTYTGGLTIPVGDTACIRGNGALIDLQGSTIHVEGKTVWLDIDYCVLVNGGDPAYSVSEAALNFVASYGSVTNNTIYGNTVGVRVYLSGMNGIIIKNNIVMNNAYAGVLCQLGSEPHVIFNDTWGNSGYGDYAMDCG